jgi:hypothetical protein
MTAGVFDGCFQDDTLAVRELKKQSFRNNIRRSSETGAEGVLLETSLVRLQFLKRSPAAPGDLGRQSLPLEEHAREETRCREVK